ISREASLAGKRFEVVTTPGGRKTARKVNVPKDTLVNQRALEEWLAAARKPGDAREKWGVTWEEADIDQKETYTFRASKDVVLSGVKTRLLSVEVESDGAKMPAEVFPDGKVFSAEVGGLLTIKMEPEKVAKAVDESLVDLMSAASVVLDEDLGLLGRAVDVLKLELSDIGDFKFPASHRQAVTEGKGSVTVELKRDFRVAEGAALTKADERRWTRHTPRIQCDEKAIREKAEEAVGDEKDPLKRARRLARWVYKALKKSYSDNAETSLEVLQHKAGDCTEHALLYVALCRSLGIPAREVGGLAYVRGSKPMLGWHAWAEVHDGHQWISVDPTWDQFYVDGTHLKLSEGSRDNAWANLAGKVRVKVLDFKRRGK
ncbi:MAG: transglutaminase-like domain-containing protein, partial [Gemmataceae bacterium]